jgi:hypothetical protein
MALQDYFEPSFIQGWEDISDGFGGTVRRWIDGDLIYVGYILNQSMEARVAEAQGIRSVYTIISHLNSELENTSVIRRIKDNAFYRITSDFNETPDIADVKFKQASAEKVERP